MSSDRISLTTPTQGPGNILEEGIGGLQELEQYCQTGL